MSELVGGQTYQNKRGDYLEIEERSGSFLDQYGRQYDADGVQMGHTHKSTGNVDLATAGTTEGWRDESEYTTWLNIWRTAP